MRKSREQRWQNNLYALQQFVAREGTSMIGSTCVEVYQGEKVAIGSWVAHTRKQYRSGLLSDARQRELQAVNGWVWSKRKPGRRYDISRDSEMVALYSQGTRVCDLAQQFNLSRQRVHQILRASNVGARGKVLSRGV
jgi:hypothetical protein